MTIKTISRNNKTVAVISATNKIITDVQSALDLIMSVKYDTKTDLIAIDKKTVCEDFFILSTGLAGEVLQKFINYQTKVAFIGDYSKYTSKPLKDFIYECNNGKDIFFVNDEKEAVDYLVNA